MTNKEIMLMIQKFYCEGNKPKYSLSCESL